MFPLLNCCVEAAVSRLGKFLVCLVPGGDALVEVVEFGADVWERWKKLKPAEADRREELQALAHASAERVEAAVRAAIQAEAAGQPDAVKRELTTYLIKVQATVRRTLCRPGDPDGRTVPAYLGLNSAEDLLPLLPPQPPRFEPGELSPPRRGVPGWVWLAGSAAAGGLAAVAGMVVVLLVLGNGSRPKKPDGPPVAAKGPGGDDRLKDADKTKDAEKAKEANKSKDADPDLKKNKTDTPDRQKVVTPKTVVRSAKMFPGLLAYWPFDEGAGDSPADVSGDVRGKGHNIAWVDGVRGKAIRVKGKGSHFDFSAHPKLSFVAGADFTFCGWVRTRQKDGVVLSNRADADGTPTIDLHLNSGVLGLGVRQQGATDYIASLKGAKVVSDGEWHHFAFTRQGADLALYTDGELEQRLDNTRSGGAIPTDLRALGAELYWLKEREGLDTDFLAGDFDEFCVFGRALSATEIRTLAGKKVPD